MDDAGNPPEKPESNVYPNICSNVRVRGHSVRLDEDVPALHRPFSENDLIISIRTLNSACAGEALGCVSKLTEEYSQGWDESASEFIG